MKKPMPRTPFSTPLSGSARETEIRLKNIFSGPKKRPPALFLALVFAMCLLCGNLVSCQVSETPPDVSTPDARVVTMDRADPPREDVEAWLLRTLLQAADEEQPFQDPVAHSYGCIQKDSRVFGAAFVKDRLENTLLLGVMDQETHALTGPLFRHAVRNGTVNVVTFQSSDGENRLLYTLNSQENGQYLGQAGLVRFTGQHFTWEWPVEGDIRDRNGPTYQNYQEYWTSHLALLAPGGVDVYTVNPDFVRGKADGPASMWQLDHNETFYYDSSSAEELPMPIYFQSLKWLNETMEPEAGWRILSLTLNEERSGQEKNLDCYTLWAHTDDDQNELTADLFFPYELTGSQKSYGGLKLFDTHTNQTSPGIGDTGNRPDKTDKKDDDWDWVDKWDEEWEKEQEAKQIAEYQSVGVTMDGKDYYYQGQLVNIFLDQRPNKSVYTLNQNPAGTVNVKILRDAGGTITGAAYLTAAETAELAELFED